MGKKTPSASKTNKDSPPKSVVTAELPAVPFATRLIIIVLTSYIGEKIWRYRGVVSQGWYSDKQTTLQQGMITLFEYIIAMGLLFFMGIFISKAIVSLQGRIQS